MRLIESAYGISPSVQGYRDQAVESILVLDQPGEREARQHRREIEFAAEFERFDDRVNRKSVMQRRERDLERWRLLLTGAAGNAWGRRDGKWSPTTLASMGDPWQIGAAARADGQARGRGAAQTTMARHQSIAEHLGDPSENRTLSRTVSIHGSRHLRNAISDRRVQNQRNQLILCRRVPRLIICLQP